jgi:hypothetical protein
MLIFISLFRIDPQIPFTEYEQFERSVIQRYTDFYLSRDIAYLGVFRPYGLADYNCAEIHLVNASTLEEGQRMVVTPPNAPEDILAIESVCRTLHVPGMRMIIWLKPIEVSSFARGPVDLKEALLRLYFYVPHPMRSLEEFHQFECLSQPA